MNIPKMRIETVLLGIVVVVGVMGCSGGDTPKPSTAPAVADKQAAPELKAVPQQASGESPAVDGAATKQQQKKKKKAAEPDHETPPTVTPSPTVPAAETGVQKVQPADQQAHDLKPVKVGALHKGEIVLKAAATNPIKFDLGDELEYELSITVDERSEPRSVRVNYRLMNPTDELRAYAYYLALFDTSGRMIFCSGWSGDVKPGTNANLEMRPALGGGILALPDANIDRISYQLRYYEADEWRFPPDSDLSKIELPMKGNVQEDPIVVRFGKENAVPIQLGELVDVEARLFVLGYKTSTNFMATPYHHNPGKQAVRYTYRLALFDDTDQLIACKEVRITLEPGLRGNGSLSFFMPESALRSIAKYDLQYAEELEHDADKGK